ncbi:Elongin-C [Gracilariopsis chorda]|uniref:Elongin-C n=1 Tax=Gracilariopsis chorda TaxID=448386 RepID=A0A2V3ILT9_9FLOR|nr:Elongin-C [Gracilariopsis chorda]|eukprot:PXF43051.1 Elongin-C [Gracilariopsis chorda]
MEQSGESIVPEGLIRLVSGDGFQYTIEAQYATVSGVIQTMMNSSFKESRTRIVNLPHVKGRVLERICQYFYYIPRFRGGGGMAPFPRGSADSGAVSSVDSFVGVFEIPPELSIDIYVCARYLDM